jgi:hypothetical protein
MDKNKIKLHLQSLVKEAEKKPVGLAATEKTQKKEKDVNKEYYKEVSKKMSEYDKIAKGDKDSIKKDNLEKFDSEEMDVNPNGMDQIQYDNDPGKKFKDRAIEALEGSSKMGNKTYEGEWDPSTGAGNGNTEEVWGASGGKHTGKEIVKNAVDVSKKDARPQEDAVGYVPQGKVKTKLAVENKEINKQSIKENKMKRLNFKKPFNGVGKALTLIPETYKVDNKVFEMTDGNENYRIRWEGSLTEGNAVILMASDNKMMNENIQHMKHLMGFKAESTLGTPSSKDRMNEDSSFRDMMNLTASLLSEDTKSDKDVITENVGAGAGAAGAGFGFSGEGNLEGNVAEGEVAEGEEIDESKGENPDVAAKGDDTKIGATADGVVRGAGHDKHIMEEDDSVAEEIDESFGTPTIYTLSEGEVTQSIAAGDDLGTDIGKTAKGDPRGEGHDTHIMEEDDSVAEGEEEIDEAFGDAFRSYDKIFFREYDDLIQAAMNAEGPAKDDAYKQIYSALVNFAKKNKMERGSAQSLSNEVKRKIYGGEFKGKYSA